MTIDQEKHSVFQGELGEYKLLKTEDGSTTLHSEHFNEACHSLAGAYEETFHNYVYGCEITNKARRSLENHTPLLILEVGFGLGVGYQCTIEQLLKEFKTEELQKLSLIFVSLELDKELIHWSQKNAEGLDQNTFPALKSLEYNKEGFFHAQKNQHHLYVLMGDARESIKKQYQNLSLPKSSAIYQDPFSPKRNPILWTMEWFQDLKTISQEDCILSTYSSSQSVRKTMMAAGWVVKNSAGYKTKKRCTQAFLVGESDQVVIEETKSEKIQILRD